MHQNCTRRMGLQAFITLGELMTNSLDTIYLTTVLPAKSDNDFMICLQSYQGPVIIRSLVYYEGHPIKNETFFID